MDDPLYIEVTPLLCKRLTGVGRFVARLVEALNRRSRLRLVTTVSRNTARARNLSTALPCGTEIALEKSRLPECKDDLDRWTRDLLRLRQDFHDDQLAGRCAGLYTWLRPGLRHFSREICILYDFTPAIVPWAHTPCTREDFGVFVGQTSAICDRALAISKSTKADAAWLCDLPSDHIVVRYPGPSMCVHSHAWTEPVQRADNIILVVSTREPRKNGPFLFDWFRSTEVLDKDAQLWWVGPKGWCAADNMTTRTWGASRSARRKGRTIKFLGMVSDRRLCQLYKQAGFSIYPSLYEGFGFPVLDSLRHGTPVLCSFNSSLQEFSGPGVFYFDACDQASLDNALGDLLTSRTHRTHRGDLDRQYSWDSLAQTVLGLCA